MRIALFHNLPSGGAKRAVYEWTSRLAQKHSIDVFSLGSADHAYGDIRSLVRSYKVYPFSPRKLFKSPFGRLNQMQRWLDLGTLAKINHRIAAEINRGGYEVVFANPCRYTFIPSLLPYLTIPSVYYLHEPFGRTFQRQIGRPYLRQNKLRQFLDRGDPLIWMYHHRLDSLQSRSLAKATLLLANSQFTREQMRQGFGLEAAICHYGVDSDQFHPQPGLKKENMLISVGELSLRKGFDFVIESVAQLPGEGRPRLLLACNRIDPQEQAYIQNLANARGVELQLKSNLNTQELAMQYNLARLCIYAPYLEPFGLVPLEAMACGTPVVGVREGGVSETILHERTGLLVERDTVKFGAAIRFLLENPASCSEFGRQARVYVEREWSWSKSTADLERNLAAAGS